MTQDFEASSVKSVLELAKEDNCGIVLIKEEAPEVDLKGGARDPYLGLLGGTQGLHLTLNPHPRNNGLPQCNVDKEAWPRVFGVLAADAQCREVEL